MLLRHQDRGLVVELQAMDVETYQAAVVAHSKWMTPRLVVWAIVYLAWVAAVAYGTEALEPTVGVTIAEILRVAGLATAFMLLPRGLRWLQPSTSRNAALVCRHCRADLHALSSVVVATQNCPSCGRQVLERPVLP